MRSAFRSGRCIEAVAKEKLSNLLIFDIQVATDELGQLSPVEILQFAHHYDLSAYDAGYLYIAKQMRLPLATLDKNLRRAAASAKIKLL
jgi:predicted nucleic acid-binding protein